RPDAFISEAFVVAFLFLGAEPNAAQRVTGMVGGNANVVLGVDAFAVSAARAVGDPRAIGGEEHGLESGDQATGGDDHLHTFIVVGAADVHVRLAIGDDEQRLVLQFAAQADAQAFSRPQGIVGVAKASFLLGG